MMEDLGRLVARTIPITVMQTKIVHHRARTIAITETIETTTEAITTKITIIDLTEITVIIVITITINSRITYQLRIQTEKVHL